MKRKKTTIVLEQTIAKHLRIHALRQDRTMSSITETALQEYFAIVCPDWKKDYIKTENDIETK
jgi:predicted transcriptional regulator